MTDFHHFLLFLGAAMVLAIAPGPGIFYVLARTLGGGRRQGIESALGTFFGGLFHVFAAALGVSAILAASAVAFHTVKYAGAAYLVWLGIRMIHTRNAEIPAEAAAPAQGSFRQGILTEALNPKTALFFLAFLPQFVDPSRGAVAFQIAFLGLLFTLMGLTSDGLYALVAGTAGRWVKRKGHYLRWERYVTGGVFIGLGVTAAFAGKGRE